MTQPKTSRVPEVANSHDEMSAAKRPRADTQTTRKSPAKLIVISLFDGVSSVPIIETLIGCQPSDVDVTMSLETRGTSHLRAVR